MDSRTQESRHSYNESTVRIEKLVYGGEGLARINGQVVLAPFVLPGEEVSLASDRVKSGVMRGTALAILRPAPERVVPRCEYFGQCGGCHYQHADYSFQLQQKCEILRETFRRLASIDLESEIKIVSADQWFYRNRVQLHFADNQSGFLKAGSHELSAIDHCYISSPTLVDVIAKIAGAVKRPEWPRFLESLEIFTNERDIQLTIVDTKRPVAARFFDFCGTLIPALAKGPIEYAAAGFKYRISRRSFFQVNRFLIDQLVEETLSDAEGGQAIDLYAGVGLFSLPLAQRFRDVAAVERGRSAFHDLEWNGRDFLNLRPVQSSAEDFLRNIETTPDLMLADPPRAGLGREATQELLRIRPRKLIIVSCDIATLARDVKKLLEAYRIARVTLVDLFPQTYHFETVMDLVIK